MQTQWVGKRRAGSRRCLGVPRQTPVPPAATAAPANQADAPAAVALYITSTTFVLAMFQARQCPALPHAVGWCVPSLTRASGPAGQVAAAADVGYEISVDSAC